MQSNSSRTGRFVVALVMVVAVLFGGLPATAQTTVNYIGPNEGTYNLGANWDLSVVPINDAIDTYNVVIPASTSEQARGS